jgi:hypothetical protein
MTAPLTVNPSVTAQIPQPHRGPLPLILGSQHAARGR